MKVDSSRSTANLSLARGFWLGALDHKNISVEILEHGLGDTPDFVHRILNEFDAAFRCQVIELAAIFHFEHPSCFGADSPPVDPPVLPRLRLLPVLWLAAMLAGLYALQLIRRTPLRRRYAAAVPVTLLLVSVAILAGCSGGRMGTPAGPAQLTITATSGTMVQTTPVNSVTLTVQ